MRLLDLILLSEGGEGSFPLVFLADVVRLVYLVLLTEGGVAIYCTWSLFQRVVRLLYLVILTEGGKAIVTGQPYRGG